MPSLNTNPTRGPLQAFRTLDDLVSSPEVQKQLARFVPEDADATAVRQELATLATGKAAADDEGHDPARASRRRFLKLMGASMALAGLSACRWPEQAIVPYNERPEGRVPGRPEQYATIHDVDGVAGGLLVTSFDGRPIKIEGNPSHPINGATYQRGGKPYAIGTATAQDQATILDLYDPDRSKSPLLRAEAEHVAATWLMFQGFWRQRREMIGDGAGFVVLAAPSSSPTQRRLRDQLHAAYPAMTWLEYAPISRDNVRQGSRLAFGRALRPQLHLAEAAVIAVFDEDLFNEHPAALKYARDFADGRRMLIGKVGATGTAYNPFGEEVKRPVLQNRLYVVEANFSATGAAADHRMPVPGSHIGAALAQVARLVFAEVGGGGDAATRGLIDALGRGAAGPLAERKARALAADLLRHRGTGRAVVSVGARQAPEVHALGFALNVALNAVGTTLTFTEEIDEQRPDHLTALTQFAERLERGDVTDLLLLGTNPVYTAPGLGLAEKIAAVEHTMHLATHFDETSRHCQWHLAASHFLEAWGDGLGYDGSVGLQQPLISPMYDSRSAIELLNFLATGEALPGHELVQQTWSQAWGMSAIGSASFQRAWRRALHDGVVSVPNVNRNEAAADGLQRLLAPIAPTLQLERPQALVERVAAMPSLSADALEVVLVPDARLYDGRYANNGWLQETPEFLTTMTWDNALLVGLRTARALGVEVSVDDYADVVTVRAPHLDEPIDVPVYVMPGLPEYSAVLWLGFGREHAGRIAGDQTNQHGAIGVNAYALRTKDQPWVVTGVRVTKAGRRYPLALLQNHWRIDKVGAAGRQERIGYLVRETTQGAYRKDPTWVGYPHYDHFPEQRTQPLWKDPETYDQPAVTEGTKPEWAEQPHYKWGMAIDLSACVGCNACIVACTAENNVPVVGKAEVRMGREMHWIRNDRYFAGPQNGDDPRNIDEEEVHVLNQVVMCMHCETAPCETVCPVTATLHDHHGLNAMVYNRCIGTRYCSNNCPYKVRRFNYFYNHRNVTEVEKMRFNPQVTVRSRGVMEKCTYCVQRIELTKQFAKSQGDRRVEDGEIVPACAQTCPTQAIVFGDLNDPNSAVSRLQTINKSYNLLNDLNTRPRTKYLGTILNPNPELESEHGDAAHRHGH